ncbi:hypothetical protein SBADM41S_00198 [Streptomyces badius]
MSTTTLTEKPGEPGKPSELDSGRRLLRGLPWLVVRQHRVALACVRRPHGAHRPLDRVRAPRVTADCPGDTRRMTTVCG